MQTWRTDNESRLNPGRFFYFIILQYFVAKKQQSIGKVTNYCAILKSTLDPRLFVNPKVATKVTKYCDEVTVISSFPSPAAIRKQHKYLIWNLDFYYFVRGVSLLRLLILRCITDVTDVFVRVCVFLFNLCLFLYVCVFTFCLWHRGKRRNQDGWIVCSMSRIS